MTNTVSLNQNKQFRRLYYRGNSKHSKVAALFYLKNNLGYNRIGFTVSKKIGKAVRRNKARRLMYEAYRLNESGVKSGYDLCLVAKADINGVGFHDVERSVCYMLKRAELFSATEETCNASSRRFNRRGISSPPPT